MSIGKTVRLLMDRRNITFSELVKITNLPKSVITNVLNDRTHKPEYINNIAQALDVSLETLWFAKPDYIVDFNIYATTIELVQKVLRDFQITEISFSTLHRYEDSVYNFLIGNRNPSSAESYLKGKIEAQLKFGIIKSTI